MASSKEYLDFILEQLSELEEMILIEDIEDKSFLMRLIKEMYEVLPAPKVKKKAWQVYLV